MATRTLEQSTNIGTLSNGDGQSADVRYILVITQDVYHKPGFGPFEDHPEVHLSFPDGTGGLSGHVTFRAVDGRTVACFVEGGPGAAIITGSLA